MSKDPTQYIPFIGLLVDIIGDWFQRSPENQKRRELRRLRRRYERGKIDLEQYNRLTEMVEAEYSK